MIVEQDGRELIQIDNDHDWQKLPKNIEMVQPVYFRRTATGIDLWPMWPDFVAFPKIWVSP